MKYLAIFFWAGDDTASWSVEVDTLDKSKIISALLHKGAHTSLEYATILVIENGGPMECVGNDSRPAFGQGAPKVIKHWSALNGDL